MRSLRRFAEALVAGLVAGFVLLVLGPVVLGWRPYTVLTGSMRPGIQPGDVVMDRPIPVSEAHVGQVVTFSDPGRHGDLVTHRIRSIARLGPTTNVETRGDANNTSEHWSIATKDRVGLVVYRLPKVGRLAVVMRSRVGILLAVVLPVLLLGFSVLRSIWKEDDDDPDDGGPDVIEPTPDEEPRRPGSDAPESRTDAQVPPIPDTPPLALGVPAASDPFAHALPEPEPAISPAERAGAGADR